MSRPRADLGFAAALDAFDPQEWAPAPAPRPRAPEPEARTAAAAAGFLSREPRAEASASQPSGSAGAGQGTPPRRRRTGRNAQLNLKARPETIAAFAAIADSRGWGFGETFEHAVALLERAYGAEGG